MESRIAFFDLGFAKESYKLNSSKYGGGAVVAKYLNQCNDLDFYLFAPEESLIGLGAEDRPERCYPLSEKVCKALRDGYPLDKVIKNIDDFDIIFHGHTSFSFKTTKKLKPPIVHWSGFDGAAGHPRNDYILLYDPSFVPKFGETAKYFTLGKPVPKEFQEYKKEDFVFQCSRMDGTMRPNIAIEECIENGIDIFLAGPIHNNYELRTKHKLVHYLGEIDEETKIDYYKRAKMFTLLHAWHGLPFNQSIIECQAYGTPFLAPKIGPFFNRYLKEGINGFNYNSHNFKESWEKCGNIDQRKCWESARKFSTEEMVRTLKIAFEEIIQEWS